jgi:integrase
MDNLINYVKITAEIKRKKAGGNKRGNCQSYMALACHLERYAGADVCISAIDRPFCYGFIDYLKETHCKSGGHQLSENTQLAYIYLFIAVLNLAVEDDLLPSNPFRHVKRDALPRRREAEVHYLTVDEVRRLSDTPCRIENVKLAFLFACFTGLRLSDVKQLIYNSLHRDSNGETCILFRIKKTRKPDCLQICREALKFVPARNDFLPNERMFLLPSDVTVNKTLKQWAAAAGIDKKITFHVARHTNATLLLSLGVAIETVSKILGHSDMKTTQIYAKVIDKNKREAVNRLNDILIQF